MNRKSKDLGEIAITQTIPLKHEIHYRAKSSTYFKTHSNSDNNYITQITKGPYDQQTHTRQYSQSSKSSLSTGHSYSLLPAKCSNKKTLVLDLDETLVHSGFIPFSCPSDIIIKIDVDNDSHDIHVLVRPFVKEFLEKMSTRYEIIVFTASLSKYANPLLNIIDKNGHCIFRLFRQHCTLINTAFVKDLTRLGRNMKDIIILDNSPVAYALNQDNGFPIPSWFDNKDDIELLKVIPILEFLSYVPDVRYYIKQIISGNQVQYNKIPSIINSYNNRLKNSQIPITMRNCHAFKRHSTNDSHNQHKSITNILIAKSMQTLRPHKESINTKGCILKKEKDNKTFNFGSKLSNKDCKIRCKQLSISGIEIVDRNKRCHKHNQISFSFSSSEINNLKSLPCSYDSYQQMNTMRTNSSSKKIIQFITKERNIQIDIFRNELSNILQRKSNNAKAKKAMRKFYSQREAVNSLMIK